MIIKRLSTVFIRNTTKVFFAGILSVLQLGWSLATIDESKPNVRSALVQSVSYQRTPCLKYTKLSSALTFSPQREPMEVHSYAVSDGTTVNASYFYYRSAEKATKELKRKLSTALAITNRESVVDDKGRKIGTKVVGRFKSKVRNLEIQMVWTDGSNLKIISGPTLDHILHFLKPECE